MKKHKMTSGHLQKTPTTSDDLDAPCEAIQADIDGAPANSDDPPYTYATGRRQLQEIDLANRGEECDSPGGLASG